MRKQVIVSASSGRTFSNAKKLWSISQFRKAPACRKPFNIPTVWFYVLKSTLVLFSTNFLSYEFNEEKSKPTRVPHPLTLQYDIIIYRRAEPFP